jgi:DNA-binding response OmpR family regulator
MSDRPVCRVLLVEDDPDTREIMARLMRRAGCAVVAVASVAEAVGRLAHEPLPTHVLLDLMLPDESGDALLMIRREGLPVRVALLTAAGPDSNAFTKAMRLRPDAVFHKPVLFEHVKAWVAAW